MKNKIFSRLINVKIKISRKVFYSSVTKLYHVTHLFVANSCTYYILANIVILYTLNFSKRILVFL